MQIEDNEKELNSYIDEVAGIEDENTELDNNLDDNEEQTNDISDRISNIQEMDQPQKEVKAEEQDKVDPKKEQPKPEEQNVDTSQLRRAPGGLFFTQTGDMVDKNGKVVYNRGAESRLYLQKERAEAALNNTNEKVRHLEMEVQKNQLLGGYAQQQGLTTDDLAQASRLAARVKRGEILDVAKEVVAMAAAQGHNVTEILGSEVGDSIDMRALAKLVDTRLAPITSKFQKEQQEQSAATRGEQAYNAFVSQHEYADIHGDDIVNVAKQENVPLSVAYMRLRSFADKNQLDFAQPLAPQINARRAQMQQQRPTSDARNKRPLTKDLRGGNQSSARPAAETFANPDAGWGEIIRSVQEQYKQ